MLFLLRHAHKIEEPPEALTKGIFGEVLELARISKFTQDELDEYEARMMTERDRVAALMWAEKKGLRLGETRGITIGSLRQAQAMAKRMLAKDYPLEEIESLTGLSEPEILSLENP